MKVLAVDTSSKYASVAVIEDGRIIKELYEESEREHSETLMPMIKNILEEVNLKLEDFDLYACGVGPGSFTGIRIGIATIKAFSDANNIPLVGINNCWPINNSVEFNLLRVNKVSTDTLNSLAIEYKVSPFFTL